MLMTVSNRFADADALKKEVDRHGRLHAESEKQLWQYLRLRLTWASNALEGNSLTETETKVVIEDAQNHPIEFAAHLHTRLVTIHPFVDGNGRAARLLMNLALLQEGYPVTIIPPVIRSDYLSAVRQSNTGNNGPFLNLLSSMVWESQRDYLRLLQSLERK